MKKILILGSDGDLAKSIIENIDKKKNKIYKLNKKNINFNHSNSKKKIFFQLKKINPDIIINCIGYFDINIGDFDKIIKSNIYPTWVIIQYYLINNNFKVKIFSIGSSCNNKPRKNYILYAASVTALNNMISSSKELFQGTNININIINPKAFKSKLRTKALKLLKINKKKDKAMSKKKITDQILNKIRI
jgi:short-subunit dehydrogenase